MLTDLASVGFRVENFTHENMAILEKDWPKYTSGIARNCRVGGQFRF